MRKDEYGNYGNYTDNCRSHKHAFYSVFFCFYVFHLLLDFTELLNGAGVYVFKLSRVDVVNLVVILVDDYRNGVKAQSVLGISGVGA